MSSYGDSFTVEKLEVKQQLNVKTYTDASDSLPPTEGAQIGDVWITAGNDTATANGVWIYEKALDGITNTWIQCCAMNGTFGGGGAA